MNRSDQSPRYLPQFPFQENPTLHSYAAMLKLYLGQIPNTSETNPLEDEQRIKSSHPGEYDSDRDPSWSNLIQLLGMPSVNSFDSVSVREAIEHLRRALELDPDNPASEHMLKWVIISNAHHISAVTILTWSVPNLPAAQLPASKQDGTS